MSAQNNPALPVWPTSLPRHVRRPSFRSSPLTERAQFTPDSGDPIAVPRTTVRMEEMSVTYRMNDAQLATFKDFVWDDLGQATSWFQAYHPVTQAVGRMKIVSDPLFQERRVTQLRTDVTMDVLWREVAS
ncbi:MAG: hypothetical protein AAFO77_08050 [Pseudomonadota bacterium]